MTIKPLRGVKPTQSLNQFPYLASPKIDGMRAIVKDDVVYSKTMKPIPQPQVQELFKHLNGVDGELVVGPPNSTGPDDDVFDRSRGILMRKADEPDADIRFYVFDRWDIPKQSASARQKELKNIASGSKQVFIVPQVLVKTQEEVDAFLKQCLEAKFEGAMLRQFNGLYKYGTSTEKESYLLKLKPLATGDAIILDVIEQQANLNEATTDELGYTKRSSSKSGKVGKGTFGAFLVRDLETGAEFSVGNGPGLTHALRDELWARRHELPGQYITFRYQAIGTKDAPRQPQFLHFRDATDISETVM